MRLAPVPIRFWNDAGGGAILPNGRARQPMEPLSACDACAAYADLIEERSQATTTRGLAARTGPYAGKIQEIASGVMGA